MKKWLQFINKYQNYQVNRRAAAKECFHKQLVLTIVLNMSSVKFPKKKHSIQMSKKEQQYHGRALGGGADVS